MAQHLDQLDVCDPGVPATNRVLAALGPKMLGLAKERAGGVNTYLVNSLLFDYL